MLESIEKRTGKAPKALIEKPTVSIVSADFLDAFQDLCVSRENFISPLSIADMRAYFDGCKLFDDFIEFLHIMQAADRVFVEGSNK